MSCHTDARVTGSWTSEPRLIEPRRAALPSLAAGVGLALAALLACGGVASAQQTYPTPEAAADGLIEAAKTATPGFVEKVFGPGSRDLLSTGDSDEDKKRLKSFNDAAAEKHAVVEKDASTRVLEIGSNAFAFPVPIVKKGDAWVFDVQAGRAELLNRTIGFNELSAIEACHAYVEAQKEYFRLDRDNDDVQSYAQKILSSPGRHDGLYWEPETQADRSPLDSMITGAILDRARKAEPYRGYYYRILKAQGPFAPGGAYRYVINGRMIAGFALVAFPAEWGKTGVMSFICNQQGRVYQKNLGPRTTSIAERMLRYDPDKTWTITE
jgi:hypothetical protein